jgi:hypothetical protein
MAPYENLLGQTPNPSKLQSRDSALSEFELDIWYKSDMLPLQPNLTRMQWQDMLETELFGYSCTIFISHDDTDKDTSLLGNDTGIRHIVLEECIASKNRVVQEQ